MTLKGVRFKMVFGPSQLGSTVFCPNISLAKITYNSRDVTRTFILTPFLPNPL